MQGLTDDEVLERFHAAANRVFLTRDIRTREQEHSQAVRERDQFWAELVRRGLRKEKKR